MHLCCCGFEEEIHLFGGIIVSVFRKYRLLQFSGNYPENNKAPNCFYDMHYMLNKKKCI